MDYRRGYIKMSTYKTKQDENGNYICLVCDKILSGRRKRYCSNECRDIKWTQNSHGWLRIKLLNKSNHTCQKCGKQPRVQDKYPTGIPFEWLDDSKLILDHKIPIALGGAEFDESNLWILCDTCNREKTKEDLKKIAEARRIERKQLVNERLP